MKSDFEHLAFVDTRDQPSVVIFPDRMHLYSQLRLNDNELATLAEHPGSFLHSYRTMEAR